MHLLINTAKKRKPDQTIAVEVRSFNLRALACYKKIGFIEKDRYRKKTLPGEDEFIYLEYSEDIIVIHSKRNTFRRIAKQSEDLRYIP